MSDRTEPLSDAENELLIVRCQLGEPAAFVELIQQWSGRLLHHLQRTAGQDMAEDLAQEVWIRALRGIPRLRDGAKLRAWLFGIAHHVAIDRLRHRYAETAMLAAVADVPAAEPDADAETRSLLLNAELARLPLVEREALTLFYLEGLSLAELADVQAVPIGTAKSRLFRARQMLRDSMTKGDQDA
ncbi:sigma-70 family RNA polymerase sigma factor [Sphingomonas sp. AP4-R1]|uniref:RNA polymerase sigma factor n=1 Tax=Sphingomonas sp. AP4-R1 TaxID=2735134 RepID=UPI0014935976|nr:sigma-70 family RNA polymerase sigma factor [Sphingomonas sp. AP4-R1]QJU57798.1 sigma-70 family RNA polymerase sigma factor [Sphingomonas sp. AP4-R1]